MSTQPDSESGIGRRRFLQGVGATAAIGTGLASTGTPAAAVDWDTVSEMAGEALAAPPIRMAWMLRDVGILGSDAPPEGLTASALKKQVYQTARTRRSNNQSTLIDNQNLIGNLDQVLYQKGKTAGIEALNEGLSQSEVQAAATDAANAHATTVMQNFLRSWNEAVAELDSLATTVDQHPDVDLDTILDQPLGSTAQSHSTLWTGPTSQTETLPDGSEMTVQAVEWGASGYDSLFATWSPSTADYSSGASDAWEFNWTDEIPIAGYDGSDSFGLLPFADWNSVYSDLNATVDSVADGLITWVDNVYGQVQSGEIDTSELITPSQRANMMAEEESQAQAIADLAALNIPVDVERQATVTIEETNATIRGTLAITDESDGPIEAGTTYDPSTLNGDVYITFDTSLLEGDWSAFQTGVDGGNMTITEEPYPGTVYRVDTAANETVTVNATDWQATGNGTWYYDASSQLDTTITEIADVDYFAATSEPNYETIKLSSSFTVETFTNTETGEEAQQASFESSEPQSDSNYITQEEWDQLQEQNEELIQKYEESQESGGGGITLPGVGDVEGLGAIAGGVAVVGGVGVVLKKIADFYLPG